MQNGINNFNGKCYNLARDLQVAKIISMGFAGGENYLARDLQVAKIIIW